MIMVENGKEAFTFWISFDFKINLIILDLLLKYCGFSTSANAKLLTFFNKTYTYHCKKFYNQDPTFRCLIVFL